MLTQFKFLSCFIALILLTDQQVFSIAFDNDLANVTSILSVGRDVDPQGVCKQDISVFCSHVTNKKNPVKKSKSKPKKNKSNQKADSHKSRQLLAEVTGLGSEKQIVASDRKETQISRASAGANAAIGSNQQSQNAVAQQLKINSTGVVTTHKADGVTQQEQQTQATSQKTQVAEQQVQTANANGVATSQNAHSTNEKAQTAGQQTFAATNHSQAGNQKVQSTVQQLQGAGQQSASSQQSQAGTQQVIGQSTQANHSTNMQAAVQQVQGGVQQVATAGTLQNSTTAKIAVGVGVSSLSPSNSSTSKLQGVTLPNSTLPLTGSTAALLSNAGNSSLIAQAAIVVPPNVTVTHSVSAQQGVVTQSVSTGQNGVVTQVLAANTNIPTNQTIQAANITASQQARTGVEAVASGTQAAVTSNGASGSGVQVSNNAIGNNASTATIVANASIVSSVNVSEARGSVQQVATTQVNPGLQSGVVQGQGSNTVLANAGQSANSGLSASNAQSAGNNLLANAAQSVGSIVATNAGQTTGNTVVATVGQSAGNTLLANAAQSVGSTVATNAGQTTGNTVVAAVGQLAGNTLLANAAQSVGGTVATNAGQTTGNTMVATAGQSAGNTSLANAGQSIGNAVVTNANQAVGNAVLTNVGQTSGNTALTNAGQLTGNSLSTNNGQSNGNTLLNNAGQLNTNTLITNTGQTLGATVQNTAGQAVGNTAVTNAGQLAGNTLLNNVGQAAANILLNTTAQTTANLASVAAANNAQSAIVTAVSSLIPQTNVSSTTGTVMTVDLNAVASTIGSTTATGLLDSDGGGNSTSTEGNALPKILAQIGLRPNLTSQYLKTFHAPHARCLVSAIIKAKHGLSRSHHEVSEDCKKDVSDVFVRRSQDVYFDLPLLGACSVEIQAFCPLGANRPYDIIPCLKRHKRQIRRVCFDALTIRQMDSAEDIAFDSDVSRACLSDRENLCPDSEYFDGSTYECLENELGLPAPWHQDLPVSEKCAHAMFVRRVEDSEDMRFSVHLSAACASDREAFCSKVKHVRGKDAVMLCLERFVGKQGFSDECSAALTRLRQGQAVDVRLHFGITMHCAADAEVLCPPRVASILTNMSIPYGGGVQVLECLRKKILSVDSALCRSAMHQVMVLGHQDNRHDWVLQQSCRPFIAMCPDSSDAISCLAEQKDKQGKTQMADAACVSALSQRLAERSMSLSFNPNLAMSCVEETRVFCDGRGGSQVLGSEILDCLSDHRTHHGFGDVCRKALVDHLIPLVTDVRNMAELNEECKQDMLDLCGGIEPGQGRMIACLQANRNFLKNKKCKTRLLRLLGYAAEDTRLGASLSEACKADVQANCAGVSEEGGAVHACLRSNAEKLTQACREAEELLEEAEAGHLTLHPRIKTDCAVVINSNCKGMEPAQLPTCLMAASKNTGFPLACKVAMQQLIDRSGLRYNLNPLLKQECESDVAKLCNFAKLGIQQWRSGPEVLMCLASNVTKLGKSCRHELGTAVELQMSRYRVGMPLTSLCDGDVMAKCHVDKLSAAYLDTAYVQHCLSGHYGDLHRPCKNLIALVDNSVLVNKGSSDHVGGSQKLQDVKEIVAEVRRQVEPHILSSVNKDVKEQVAIHHIKHVQPQLQRIIGLARYLAIFMIVVVLLLVIGARVLDRLYKRNIISVTKDGRV